MRKIYIFGSGGFAKEVAFLVSDINKERKIYELGGFIGVDIAEESIVIGGNPYPVFEEKEFFAKHNDVAKNHFAIGTGNPEVLIKLKEAFLDKYDFPNLVHPSVIGQFEAIKFGKGNIITAGCIFTLDIKVGSMNVFNLNVTIGHDSIIGDCNVLNPGVNLSGGVILGNGNLVGTNAVILQYIRVGNNNVIGAVGMLNKNIGNDQIMVGVPARPIKK